MKTTIQIIVVILLLAAPILAQDNYNLKVEIPESHSKISAGESVWFTAKILNLGNENRKDITLKFEMYDPNKKLVVSKAETAAIETHASFVRNLEIPKNSPPGVYIIYVKIPYSDGTEAVSQASFEVTTNKKAIIIIGVAILLLLILILLVIWISYKWKKMYLKMKIHQIVNKKLRQNFKF